MFNNMVIVALCISCIPSGEIRKISNLPVFLVTIFFSLLAYIWLLVILSFSSPQKIEVWEAAVTLGFLPCLSIFSYAAEKGFFDILCCHKKQEKVNERIILIKKGIPEIILDNHTYKIIEWKTIRNRRISFISWGFGE